jgi:D-methionine transport system permease protein
MWSETIVRMLICGIGETLYMVGLSTAFSYVFGLPVGIALVMTDRGGIKPISWLSKTLNLIVNIVRSVPFLILLMFVTPFTRLVVGTTIGPNATIVPLVISAAPFIARLVESSLKELDGGVTEAAQSMGCTWFQIVRKVWLPEARPSLIIGAAIGATTILGYSAMAGVVAGGGLGDIAIRYGWYRYEDEIMIVTVAILVVIVQIMQEAGIRAARRLNRVRQ